MSLTRQTGSQVEAQGSCQTPETIHVRSSQQNVLQEAFNRTLGLIAYVMSKDPKEMREQPGPQRFLASVHKALATIDGHEYRWRFFNREPQELDGLENFRVHVRAVDEEVVQLYSLESNTAVDVDEHVIVVDSFAMRLE